MSTRSNKPGFTPKRCPNEGLKLSCFWLPIRLFVAVTQPVGRKNGQIINVNRAVPVQVAGKIYPYQGPIVSEDREIREVNRIWPVKVRAGRQIVGFDFAVAKKSLLLYYNARLLL